MKLIKNEWCVDNELVLVCPVCGFEYTHLMKVVETKSDEGRMGVELQFECEEGHQFYADFRNHKGYTVVVTEESK